MADDLLILEPGQKRFFDDNGYLLLPGFYGPGEMEEMRRQFHEVVTDRDGRPRNMSYSFMEPVEGYPPDEFNPGNVVGMMDQTLANDYWFDQFTEPRIVSVMVDLLGPNLDFHNGKIRNKPPGFTNTQGWHQDWPYVLHTEPDLAAAITYLDATDAGAGATEVIPGSHLDVLVIHQAGNNRTSTSRNAIINEYKTAETVDQWNNRCAFAGLPLARNRELLMPRVNEAGKGSRKEQPT